MQPKVFLLDLLSSCSSTPHYQSTCICLWCCDLFFFYNSCMNDCIFIIYGLCFYVISKMHVSQRGKEYAHVCSCSSTRSLDVQTHLMHNTPQLQPLPFPCLMSFYSIHSLLNSRACNISEKVCFYNYSLFHYLWGKVGSCFIGLLHLRLWQRGPIYLWYNIT